MKRVLVTGSTGNIGSEVVSQLLGTGCRVRAMSRNPRSVNLPEEVDVVRGDLLAPDTLDACLDEIDSVFLVWVAPLAAAAPAIERIAAHARHVVLLTSPHRTPHPFFQQPNALRAVHAGVEQLIESSGLRWTFLRPGPFAINCRNWWAPQIQRGDVVRWCYADAATAPVHERDIAAVAVRACPIRDTSAASTYSPDRRHSRSASRSRSSATRLAGLCVSRSSRENSPANT